MLNKFIFNKLSAALRQHYFNCKDFSKFNKRQLCVHDFLAFTVHKLEQSKCVKFYYIQTIK